MGKILHFFLFNLVSGESSDALESFLNSLVILSGSFEEWMFTVVLGPEFSLGFGNFSLIFLIRLVTDDDEWELGWVLDSTLLNEFLLPVFDAVEGFLGSDIVDDDAAVRTSVESRTNGLESFLSSGIPDLETVVLSVVGDVGGEEIGTDSSSILRGVFTSHVSVHEGGLSDTKILIRHNFCIYSIYGAKILYKMV